MNTPGGFVTMLKCCDQEGCNYKTKQAGNLKKHKANKHDIGVTWHECDQPNCKFKCKEARHLKRHKADKHDIDVKWHECDQEGCLYKTKRAESLKTHKECVHDIDATWHECDQEGCDFKTKHASSLKTHKANKHDIDVTWHECDQEGCDFKTKQACNLKKHKADKHDIGVTWHECDQEGCDFKCKQACNLKSHKEGVHDIGEHECDFCSGNRNSRNKYKDDAGEHNICNKCYEKVTGKATRKEKDWSDYLDAHLGTVGLLSSDVSLRSSGGCQLYRPDKLYTDTAYVEIGECDEYEHTRTSGDYSCDEKRISDIYDEQGIVGKTMSVLRWNPDNYVVPEGYTKISRKERLEIYVALAKKLRENCQQSDKIHVYYMFYSEDNPRLSQNIPYTLIYSMEDVNNLL